MSAAGWKALDHCVREYTHGGEEAARRVFAAALSTVRTEALEEAAGVADQYEREASESVARGDAAAALGRDVSGNIAADIRARVTTPASIPVERVREALLQLKGLVLDSMGHIDEIANGLGVDLDTETEKPGDEARKALCSPAELATLIQAARDGHDCAPDDDTFHCVARPRCESQCTVCSFGDTRVTDDPRRNCLACRMPTVATGPHTCGVSKP